MSSACLTCSSIDFAESELSVEVKFWVRVRALLTISEARGNQWCNRFCWKCICSRGQILIPRSSADEANYDSASQIKRILKRTCVEIGMAPVTAHRGPTYIYMHAESVILYKYTHKWSFCCTKNGSTVDKRRTLPGRPLRHRLHRCHEHPSTTQTPTFPQELLFFETVPKGSNYKITRAGRGAEAAQNKLKCPAGPIFKLQRWPYDLPSSPKLVVYGFTHAYSISTESSLEHDAFIKHCIRWTKNPHDPLWLANNPPRRSGGEG